MKKTKEPNRRVTQPVINWEQRDFTAGLYKDIPASDLPDTGIADSFNTLLFPNYAEVRPGTALWTNAKFPNLLGRDNYVAIKVCDVIIATDGDPFTIADLGNVFIWPDGQHDTIIQIIAPSIIKVAEKEHEEEGHSSVTIEGSTVTVVDGAHISVVNAVTMAIISQTMVGTIRNSTASNPAVIRGKLNMFEWHNVEQVVVLHIDNRVFTADYKITSWTEVVNAGSTKPSNDFSQWDQLERSGFIFNSNGIFKIDFSQTPHQMWKINESAPLNTITEPIPTNNEPSPRRYIHTMVKLSGTGNRDRTTAKIEQESAPNLQDQTNEFKDFAEIPHEALIQGAGSYLRLVGIPVLASDLSAWIALDKASFGLTMNGEPELKLLFDFTSLTSFDQIAKAIEEKMVNIVTKNAQCKYFTTNELGDGGFEMTAGREDGDTIERLTDVTAVFPGSTNIGDIPFLGMSGPNSTLSALNVENLVGKLTIPVGQTHWTHYGVYSTIQTSTNQEIYTWNEDVPVAKALTTSLNSGGNLSDPNNLVTPLDNGSVIKFADGSTYTINSGGSPLIPLQSAGIGGGRVMTASQSGANVTTTAGDNFSSSDVSKPIFWEDGSMSFINEFISATEAKVHDSTTRTSQAMTIEPTERNFSDTKTDLTLENRFDAGFSLPNRGFINLPSSEIGVIVPGFMIVANRGKSVINYSQILSGKEYLVGLYASDFQTSQIKDKIVALREYPDQCIIFCLKSTYRTSTNTTDSIATPEVGEFISLLAGINILDSSIGLRHASSIVQIDRGLEAMITSEPGIRIFNGTSYSENLAIDAEGRGRIIRDLESYQEPVEANYDPLLGYIFWASNKESVT